jgi:hypothetical protein
MSTSASAVRVGVLAGFLLLVGRAAQAAPPTKEACVDAHSKGQDARSAGQLAQASQMFLLCAQSACPDLVRSDCARFADELDKLQPTVTFAARDGAQNDLLDTSVYVDGALVTSRLGDGRVHNVDPGRHEVRFVHADKEVVLNVVVNQGEKGRPLVGAFVTALESAASPGPTPTPAGPEMKRPSRLLALVGVGAAAAVAGGVLVGVGYAQIPSSCSLATHQCAAPPGDPVFGKASSSVTMLNVGAIVGGAGAAVLGGGLIGYFAQPLRPMTTALVPWIGPQGAGLSFSGAL